MWEYTDKVREHFLNPRNVGVIENADGVGEVGSLSCGDALKLTFKVDENERITDVKFQTFGCASAIASSSALTELLKGKTLEEAEKITNDDIVTYLGGLPKEKMHCSVMGQEALGKAIACYRGTPIEEKEGEIVCECFGVTDVEIRNALTSHPLNVVEDITNYIKAGGGCGKCHERIQELIDEVKGKEVPKEEKPQKLTTIQKIRMIEETLQREIQPSLKKDGGDIELVDVNGNQVQVRLRGACSTCKAAQITLKDFVEKKLREFVAAELIVEEV
ncbi:MAG: Fe-S cluster assembly protein NifU [Desulfococcaceae bacterium]|jgi:NifU-like protein|nr:Fe-S cluster assembly protein NifU [Desulfococcaceae bacterium]